MGMPNPIVAGLLLALLLSGVGLYWLIRMNRPGMTDSPWFWGAMFCGTALIGLLAVGPRYATREAGLERQLEARTEIHRRRLDPAYGEAVAKAETEAASQPTPVKLSRSEAEALVHVKLIKTLGPLIALALTGTIVSGLMLQREQAQLPSPSTNEHD